MSRQSPVENQRIEYSDPEHLDRILEFLRRNRDDAQAGRRSMPAFDPVSDKIATPAAAPSGPVSEAPSPEAAKARPAEETRGDAAGEPSPLSRELPHVPEGLVRRLDGLVGGESQKSAAPSRPARAPKQPSPDAAATDRAAAAAKPAAAKLSATKSAAAKLAPLRFDPAAVLASGGELAQAIAQSRKAFIAAGLFSMIINVLMLAGPLFMMQVYDRVMASGSLSTLLVLSALTAGAYGIIGMLELVRSRIVVRVGVDLDRRIGDRVFNATLRQTLDRPGSAMSTLRELDNLRQFIGGPAPLTFFDAPWTPFYLLIVFMLHWWLGVAATLGAVLLVAIAWMSETRSRAPLAEANKAAQRSIEVAEAGQRNAEAITAMGMLGACRARWQEANARSLAWQVLAADRLGTLSSVSKTLRLLLQSMMLAVGAALAIKGDISAGAIIAGTILFGRALAPVEQAVGQWRQFVKARESFAKVSALLARYPAPARKTALPRPKGQLDVQSLRVAAPETKTVILNNIGFRLEPGTLLAVIGPSGSGKSTLARALVGIWEPFGGQVRLDGARLDQWDAEELGRHIGYLPQDVELFSGTVRENIARFRPDATDEAVVAAAKAAHAHDLIMSLPQSYETELGAFATYLSAGQRQRIGLARALYDDPAVVVLDEPNANLDRAGDEALSAAIDGMRERGQAIVLISHRVQAIGKADLLLYIEKGVQKAFGPRAEVLRYLQGGAPSAPPAQPAQMKPGVVKPMPAASARPAAQPPRAPVGPSPVPQTRGPKPSEALAPEPEPAEPPAAPPARQQPSTHVTIPASQPAASGEPPPAQAAKPATETAADGSNPPAAPAPRQDT